jgi:hypothetical protein
MTIAMNCFPERKIAGRRKSCCKQREQINLSHVFGFFERENYKIFYPHDAESFTVDVLALLRPLKLNYLRSNF